MKITYIICCCFRRSRRVAEISQRQEAEKIMAENIEKERAALESLQKLKPGDKVR
jgi:hypothetical protein